MRFSVKGWVWWSAWCVAMASGGAQADMGPLAPLLSSGTDGAWTATPGAGRYRLENRQEPGAIRYVYGPVAAGSEGRRRLGVTVALGGAVAEARAGLIYGVDPAQRSYWLLVAGPEGEVDWIRRDAQGFRTVMSRTVPASGPARATMLELHEQGRQLTLRVAGQDIATLSSDAYGRGAAGIVAIGQGLFDFSDYRDASASAAGAAAPAGHGGGRPTAAAAAPARATGFQAHTIVDAFGFERPMPALTLSAPAGWRVEGSVRWDRWSRCWADQNKMHFVASAPDGRQRFEFIPGGIWQWHPQWASMPQLAQQQMQRTGCQPRPLTDGRSFMQAYVQALRPGAEVVSFAIDRADTAALMRQLTAQPPQPGHRRWGEAWAVRLRYAGDGGQTVHEHLSTGLVFEVMPSVSIDGSPAQMLVGTAVGTGSSLAVGQEPDLALTRRIADSVRLQPEYLQRLQQHQRQMADLQAAALQRERQAFMAAQAARASAQRTAGTGGSSVLESSHESWKRRQGWKDAGQAKVVDATHERSAWTTTDGGVQYLPQRYQRAYQLPGEQYVGSNDAFFNPMQGTALRPHTYGR